MFKKAKKYGKERIMGLDCFGYNFSVLFDKEKNDDGYFPTLAGGVVSLCIYVTMSVFVWIQVNSIMSGAVEYSSILREFDQE